MLNMLRADLYKIYKSSTIKLLFGITALCAVIMTIMSYLIPQGKLNTGTTGIGFLFSDINMISILGAALAGVFICSDFENKSIHEAITCGIGRGSIILSKAFSYFCAVAFVLMPYAVAAAIALGTGYNFSMGNVGIGFLNLITENAHRTYGISGVLKLAVVMLTLMLVYVAQLSLCVPLAIVLKKPVFVVAIYYGFTILCAQLIGLRKSSEVFADIFAATPYGGNHTLLTAGSEAGDVIKAIVVNLIFIVIMLAATYGLFRKTEIK